MGRLKLQTAFDYCFFLKKKKKKKESGRSLEKLYAVADRANIRHQAAAWKLR